MADEGRVELRAELDGRPLEKGLDRASRQVDEFADRAEQADPQVDVDIDVDTDAAQAELDQFTASFGSLSSAADREVAALLQEFGRIDDAFEQATARLNAASRAVDFDPASREAEELRQEVVRAGREISEFADRIPPELRQVGGSFDRMGDRAQEAGRAVRLFSSRLGRGEIQNFTSAINAARVAISAFLASLLVQRAAAFTRAIVEQGVAIEQLEARYEALLGGAAAAGTRLDELRVFADDLGLSFDQVAQSSISFEQAATKAGIATGTARDIFTSVSVALKGAGADTATTGRAFDALSQIANKNVLSMEEVRQQLGEAIPGVLPILAKELNVTTAEMADMIENGEVLAAEALPALAAGLEEAFGGSAAEQAERVGSAIERLKNTVTDLARTAGQEAVPGLQSLVDALNDLGQDGTSAAGALGGALGDLFQQTSNLVKLFDDVRSARLGSVFRRLSASILEGAAAANEAGDGARLMADGLRLAADAADGLGQVQRKTFDEAELRTNRLRAVTEEANRRQREEAEETARVQAAEARGASDAAIEAAQEALAAVVDAQDEERDAALDLYREKVRAARGAAREIEDTERESVNLRIREVERELKAFQQAEKDKEKAAKDAAREQERLAVELARKEKEELDKRKKNNEDFFAALIQLAQDAAAAQADASSASGTVSVDVQGGGAGVAGPITLEVQQAQEEVDALQQKLDDLQETFLGPGSGLESIYTRQLKEAQRELAEAQQRAQQFGATTAAGFDQAAGAVGSFSAAFSSGLQENLLANEQFVGALQQLPDGLRGTALQMIQILGESAQEGTLTADKFREIGGIIGGIFQAAGVDASAFTAQLGQTSGQASSLAQQLNAIDQAARAAGDGSGQAAEAVGGTGDAADKTRPQLIRFGDKVFEVGTRAQAAAKEAAKAGKSIGQIGDKAKEAGSASTEVGKVADKVGELPAPAAEAAAALAPLATATDTLATSASTAAPPMESIANSLVEITSAGSDGGAATVLSGIGQALTEGQEAITATAEPLTTIATATTAIGESSAAGETLTAVGTALAEMADNETLSSGAESLREIATTLTEIGTTASAAAEGLSAVGEGGQAAGEGLDETKKAAADLLPENLAKDIGEVASATEELGNRTSATHPEVDTLGTNIDDAQKASAALVGELERLVDQLGEPLQSAASGAKAPLDEIVRETDEAKKAIEETVKELLRLESEGVPAIQAANAAINALRESVRALAREAREAAEALNEINGAQP